MYVHRDRVGKRISVRDYQERIQAVERHILERTLDMNIPSLANGITITPTEAQDELLRRKVQTQAEIDKEEK